MPDIDIRKILDAARLAPSASNAQPWSFLVITDAAVLRQMADAVRQEVDRMVPYAENEVQKQRLIAYKGTYYTFFENAPAVIAVFLEAYDRSTERLLERMGYDATEIERLRPHPALQSVAAAIEHILLAAHSLGYGSCWMTGPLIAQTAFERLLGYGKERTIAALLPIGIPDESPSPRSRKSLDEVSMKLFQIDRSSS